MKKPEGFSQEDLYTEFDKLRPNKAPTIPNNLMELIHYGRSKEPRVAWKDIIAYLKSKFGIDIKENTLRGRYSDWLRKK